MERFRWILAISVTFILLSGPVRATAADASNLPWEKGYVNLGVYFATLDSSFRLGSSNVGVGVNLNAEDFLGLDSSDTAFRVDAGYRFGNSRRHTVDFTWFSFDREATKTLTEDVDLPPEAGGGTIPTGVSVNSVFNFDIYRLKYNYSIIMDERLNLKLGAGLYIMPIEFGIGEAGKNFTQEDITAPLPVLAMGFDLAITPRWFLRQNLELFYLEIDNFTGSILAGQLALEYRAWKHVAIGTAVDGVGVDLEVDGDTDYPGLDFDGSVEFTYFGAQLYVKFYY